ncbi:GMC oxidoreductase [Sphaerobolus stellatus SS14]|uniref:GMC oxidoreductase n=1 Tax=Sphaerobolus stellatus (strain SS14) TaxID=990650 RepID=A0A0C9V722_SPHS4|nr:GMC oxidoreductase [Sphaerobolus stellatus SS14]
MELKKQMAEDGYPIINHIMPIGTTSIGLDTHIEEWGQSVYHYTLTCRMAPEDDAPPGVVAVDDELRVHDFQKLRIADASIFPNILATHLQATVVAMTEKCADMLKEARVTK